MSAANLGGAFRTMLVRDLLLAWRRRGDAMLPVLYAIIVATLFPFALGPEHALLARIAGGVVLVTVLLAMLLALDNVFRGDLDDGALEQMLLAPQPLSLLLAARMLAYWLVTALPLLLVAPVLAYMLGLEPAAQPVLLLALLLATPLLALLGIVLTALTAGTRRSGMSFVADVVAIGRSDR
ncbi:Cytochrome c-type biogenesis protein CcmB, partial [mine drainage metagenome]